MKKILVVDDERPIREMLKKFLLKKDYDAFTAENADDALKVLEAEKPNIVLLDIRMPKTDGVELLRRIKEVNDKAGVIMITAVSDTAVAEKCMELGAFDYITKPISLEYLEDCLLAKLIGFDK